MKSSDVFADNDVSSIKEQRNKIWPKIVNLLNTSVKITSLQNKAIMLKRFSPTPQVLEASQTTDEKFAKISADQESLSK